MSKAETKSKKEKFCACFVRFTGSFVRPRVQKLRSLCARTTATERRIVRYSPNKNEVSRSPRREKPVGAEADGSARSTASLRKHAHRSETGHLIARNEPLWTHPLGIQRRLQQIRDRPGISFYKVAYQSCWHDLFCCRTCAS